MTDSSIKTGNIQGVGIAIGTGASVAIYGDIYYYPIELQEPLRREFTPLIEQTIKLFGGRNTIIDRIMEQIQGQSGCHTVITAPAGFGKTTLMATLVHRTPAAFAYHFFTRFYSEEGLSELFFLRNVVEQMAQWHGHQEQVPQELHQLRALYQRFLTQPLDRVRILILDGLDEVTSWQLAPYLIQRLPDRMHMVLTIRDVGQDWRAVYQFPADQLVVLPLGGLDRTEITAVLHAAGAYGESLATDPTAIMLIEEIAAYDYDPTLGADPFYVRLLAEDIASGVLDRDSLDSQPRGLHAYLDGWWQQVRRQVQAGESGLQDLLGTLAVARGPISRTDLELVHPTTLVDDWSMDLFDDLLHKVRRFVLVDPMRGFMLVHPRFQQYVQSRLQTQRIHLYRGQLLALCADWQRNHSRYALYHYIDHLAEDGKWTVMTDLLTTVVQESSRGILPWYTARLLESGSDAQYLTDLEQLRQHARSSGNMPLGLRCALITASLHSRVRALSPDLLYSLITVGTPKGRWSLERALDMIRQMPEPSTQILAFEQLAQSGLPLPVGQALTTIATFRGSGNRAQALAVLVPHLPVERLSTALNMAIDLKTTQACGEALYALAPYLPPQLAVRAIERARTLTDEWWFQIMVLCAFANHLSVEEREMLAVSLQRIPFAEPRVRSALALAGQLSLEQRDLLYLDALAIASGNYPDGRDPLEETMETGIWAYIKDRPQVKLKADSTLLILLAPVLPEAHWPELLDVVVRLESYHVPEIIRILAERALPGWIPALMAATRRIKSRLLRVRALGCLSSFVEETQCDALADELLAEFEANLATPGLETGPRQIGTGLQGFSEEISRPQLAISIARVIPEQYVGRLAALVAQVTWNLYDQTFVKLALAERLPEPQRSEHMADIIALVPPETLLDNDLNLPVSLGAHLIGKVLDKRQQIEDAEQVMGLLSCLASNITSELTPSLLPISSNCSDPALRLMLLASMWPQVAEESQAAAYREILDLISIVEPLVAGRAALQMTPYVVGEMQLELRNIIVNAARDVRRGYIWGHASLLIDLMPLVTLDERAELVEQALALARTFGQYGDVQKAKLLARIANYVSPAVKPELNTELRGLARNILQTGVGKRDAWFDLLPKLPVDIQPDSIRDGLPFILDQADRQMTQLFDDLEIASSLKQSVQALLPQLLNALIGNSDATQVQKLLVALQALLPDELGGMVFLRIVDAATLYARWALAMLPFVDRQRDLIIRRIFNILNYNPDAATKAQLFGCLAPHLAEPDRLVVLHQADLALASLLSSPPDKFDTLIELSLLLAPQMSPQFQPGYFALAIGWLGGGIKGGIKDDWQLQRLSTQAATALLAWHNTDPGLALQIIPTWMDFVDHCAIRGRSMLCARLLDFMPWLAVVLPAMAINATTTALIEILQCWPTVPKEK